MMDALTISCVTKRFDGITALDGVSASCSASKITALVGPNGAGKTTLFNIISGFVRADAGVVRVGERIITRLHPWEVAALGVGRVFQDIRPFARLSVLENIMMGLTSLPGETIIGSLLEPARTAEAEGRAISKAREWASLTGLSEKGDCFAEALSYGEQKLMAIARALAGGATLLLLDEPTAGVSPAMIPRVLELLTQLRRDGITIFVIEHNMEVVHDIADTAVFLHNGRVEGAGPTADVLDDPYVKAAYMGA